MNVDIFLFKLITLVYSQPLKLSITPLRYLYDEDLIEIIHNTLPQLLSAHMLRRCVVCQIILETKSFKTIDCDCSYCIKCITDKVLKDTNQKVILNHYEKSIYK